MQDEVKNGLVASVSLAGVWKQSANHRLSKTAKPTIIARKIRVRFTNLEKKIDELC